MGVRGYTRVNYFVDCLEHDAKIRWEYSKPLRVQWAMVREPRTEHWLHRRSRGSPTSLLWAYTHIMREGYASVDPKKLLVILVQWSIRTCGRCMGFRLHRQVVSYSPLWNIMIPLQSAISYISEYTSYWAGMQVSFVYCTNMTKNNNTKNKNNNNTTRNNTSAVQSQKALSKGYC